jgi:tRNA/tmRNA/rRNA uracil-C5-methylase (TrmA/RlmC/RlmD family)
MVRPECAVWHAAGRRWESSAHGFWQVHPAAADALLRWSGTGRRVAAAVADRGPARIVHLACDPAAFARDLAAYLQGGYRLLASHA